MNNADENLPAKATVESLSALTLATQDMRRSVQFYSRLRFAIRYGGEDASFTSLSAGTSCVNLIAQPAGREPHWWGRAIFYVSDVDAFHAEIIAVGLKPDTSPRDAEWGERYFHITDPDGHELSFAKPLAEN